MKRLIFYKLIFLIASIASVHAQKFPNTRGGIVCASCAGSYDIVSGNPSLSNIFALAGEPQLSWQGQLGTKQLPMPYGDFVDSYTILTLENSNISQSKVQKKISGFQPGKTYTIRYNVLSSRTANSGYGKSATMTITTTGEFPFVTTVGSRTTTFGSNTNVWINEAFTFTASATELVFHLTGGVSASAVNNNLGYVNFDITSYPLDCILPTNQVQLSQTVLTTPFPCGKVNLNSVVTSTTPDGGKLVWQYGTSFPKGYASHLTDANSEAAGVAGSKYMAFYYSEVNDCYNTNSSTAGVQVNYVETQVSLKRSSVANSCPSNSVDLEFLVNKQVLAAGVGIRWFTNANHLGVPVDPKLISISGSYYAFLYDEINNCYSTDLSTAKVTVSITPCESPCLKTDAVELSSAVLVNECPASTVNLNSLVLNGGPQKTIYWFDNPTHSGQPLANPSQQSASGVYYAFFYNAAYDCFSTGEDSDVAVTIESCPVAAVSLNLKVFLQGATTQENGVATMRNDLQVYPTGASSFGLLPTQDPYGGGVVYPEINNTLSSVGKIVDWVKVEIRGMQDPLIILESKSLLLRADGTVVDVDGFAPKFNPQFGGARIAIKHRNHLPVLGLGIVSFNAGTVSYDFSADLSKAYQVVPKPQMILKNGVWCMIAADVNSDFYVDSGDVTSFKNGFKASLNKTYHKADLNMDGYLDSADVTIFNNNFKTGYYSSMTKFSSN